MITVHHLNNSRSQRVLWLLEELGLEYDIRHYQRDPVTMLAPESLRKIHPLGKSPVITDGDLTIAESGAIIEYLVERYGQGRLAPAVGTPERLRYTYWLHYAEGSAMPLLVLKLIFGRLGKPPMPALIRPIAGLIGKGLQDRFIDPQLARHRDYLEAELGHTGWFAGADFSAADIQMSFPIEAMHARGGADARYPHLQEFLTRIHARPAYVRALQRGGPYELGR
ncbi:glutathione S-transferase [Herbaspirillum sp. RTI4]|uniref:glutathione S-transferase n=1 Tax=Herbaspirillum sp. RTI4 TaxID=3048640 RepID=UPI002AB39583|nr:glutathione S-transferase [Herbaspirillum sp. RTI4]MDY7578438.1 glutathione S-transferase [Herbaspirillum sp. RTI4]MEA9982548.1 glutathione S-transferase [Herbaspirillum sp. RTI4]